jgi:hypothetical protein
VEYFVDLAAVVRDADRTDKAEIYRGLNLVLTYQPAAQSIRAQAHLAGDPHGVMFRVQGGDLNRWTMSCATPTPTAHGWTSDQQ